MRRLAALATLTLACLLAYPAVGGDILDSYGRQRNVPTQLATTVDSCKTIAMPSAFTDGGVGTNVLQPDAAILAVSVACADAGTGCIQDGGFGPQTATCVTLELGQEYAVEPRTGVTGCLSQTGKMYGAASTNCDGHKPISGPQAMRFSAAPDGGSPCIYAVSNSGTADKLDICPRVP